MIDRQNTDPEKTYFEGRISYSWGPFFCAENDPRLACMAEGWSRKSHFDILKPALSNPAGTLPSNAQGHLVLWSPSGNVFVGWVECFVHQGLWLLSKLPFKAPFFWWLNRLSMAMFNSNPTHPIKYPIKYSTISHYMPLYSIFVCGTPQNKIIINHLNQIWIILILLPIIHPLIHFHSWKHPSQNWKLGFMTSFPMFFPIIFPWC